MKKLFILLGVIMFSLLGCSCESSEQIKYKVSKYNDEMNEEFLYWEYMSTFYPEESILISNMVERYSYYDEIIIVDYTGDLTDYYTCGYIDKSLLKKMNDKKYYHSYDVLDINFLNNILLGKDYALVKYNNMINFTRKIKFEDYPLVWYEIPKNEEIPNELGNMFLACILESKTITYKYTDGTIRNVSEFFFENQTLYSNEDNKYEYMNELEYKSIMKNDKYMYFSNSTSIPLYTSSRAKYLESTLYLSLKTIDNVDYVCGWDEYMSGDVDLRECCEYIIEEGEYLFRLEDVISILEESKK